MRQADLITSKNFKGCLPQILLGPFLNTLSQIHLYIFLEIFWAINILFLELPVTLVRCREMYFNSYHWWYRIFFEGCYSRGTVLLFSFLRIEWRLIFTNIIRCSRLRLWVGYFVYFEFTHLFFYLMFFSSIKRINWLISKGMSSIYLKVTVEKICRSQNLDFLSLKIFDQVSFWGAPAQADIIEF